MPFFIKYYYAGILLTLAMACGNNKTEIQTFKVQEGEFFIDVLETGELMATKSVNIGAPALPWHFGMLKITHIIEDGTQVYKGDTVLLFDPSEIFKAKINANAELEIAKAELVKLLAEQSLKIQELESNLKINKLSYQIAEIQLDQAKFEADVTRKEIQLNLAKTKISLDKAQGEIENQKRIHKEEIAQAKLRIRQLEKEVQDADLTIDKMTITSPGEGIAIVSKNRSTNSKWQVGDQPWSGTSLIMLPDLNELKVETEINEVDIAKISLGQEAEIKLDAYSDDLFSGNVISVATLAKFKDHERSGIKVFPVSVILNSTSEELMPGMTVSCRIITDKIDSVLFIPSEAVQKDGAISFVYLKSGSSYRIQEILTGLTNNDFVIVEDGLDEGEVIALTVPDKFQEEAKK